MANSVQTILTTAGHEALAKSFGGPSGGFSWCYGKHFKMGTLGYVLVGTEKFPATPDESLTDIQSSVSGTYWYRKTFQASNILYISPGIMQLQCFLDLGEANGNVVNEPDTGVMVDGPKNSAWLSGAAPEFFEIGIFDPQDVLVAYGTFPREVKLDTKTLNHLVSINF